MSSKSQFKPKDEELLMSHLWSDDIKNNPYKFVMFAYPWGKEGTPLAKFKGPRTWQIDVLLEIADHIESNKIRMARGLMPVTYKGATASGRGIGKSVLVAWLNQWIMSCVIGGTCTTTANTESQLVTKTWAELGKWHTLLINSHWFERTALSLNPAPWYKAALESQLKIDTGYYYAKALLWSEEKPDSFAGTHNYYGQLLLMDEASGIPTKIWDVSEGFFTEPILHRYWLTFSNPRRNTGAFFDCFHSKRDYWKTRNIDSRTVEGIDKDLLNAIITQNGEDSDQARVEVKGQFPRQGDSQFISRELVQNAVTREIEEDDHAALMMGVDIARFGDDKSVIRFRQGRNGRVHPPIKYKGLDNMQLANQIAGIINKVNPDAVCIDAGNGTGVIDRLREMGFKVHEIWFGSKADDDQWANKRIELWARMRDWLNGGTIDNDLHLINDLTGPEYKFQGHGDKLILEPKEEMKKRGLPSPDDADALACTFAIKVAGKFTTTNRGNNRNRNRNTGDIWDYKLFD